MMQRYFPSSEEAVLSMLLVDFVPVSNYSNGVCYLLVSLIKKHVDNVDTSTCCAVPCRLVVAGTAGSPWTID